MWQLIILGLVMLVLALILGGIRLYAQTNLECTEVRCPTCGNSLDRCKRRYRDYVMCLWIPVRRYQCHYQGCRWTGWRVKPLGETNHRQS